VTWPVAFQLLIAALTVVSGFYATRAARRGKQAETTQAAIAAAAAREQEDRKQRFEELKTSLDSARLDLDYYDRQLKRARQEASDAESERDRLQEEWMKRHSLLLARCQALAVQMEAIVNGPIRLPPAQKARIENAVGDLAHHIVEDHEHFDPP
jgi:septal ring factor EnvC (AmiA/AmiB activator)